MRRGDLGTGGPIARRRWTKPQLVSRPSPSHVDAGAPSAEAASALNQSSAQLTIDARTLADAHASGLTAVNITLGYTLVDLPPYEHTLHELDVWDAIIRDNAADLTTIRTVADLHRAREEGWIGIIHGFQNAVAVGEDTGRVATFAARGVRVVQLTYNQASHIGDGSMAPENRGLTDFGRSVVEGLNDHHLMVDLSHSGERTFLDATRISRAPVSINHTGCRALADLPRNKTDEELRLVASRGGFVGIQFMPFLNVSGHAGAADVVEHIDHAVNVCGEDHVGIGTDGTVTSIDDLDSYRTHLAEHVALRVGGFPVPAAAALAASAASSGWGVRDPGGARQVGGVLVDDVGGPHGGHGEGHTPAFQPLPSPLGYF